MSSILLIADMAGYGKVALSAMIPILSQMKYQVYNLPTALVSNTFNYGKFDILETTDYMRHSMNIWNQLDFTFDAVSTGFIVSEEQTKLITEYCKKLKRHGTHIFVDPVMADEGKLYNGVTEKTIGYMRQMCEIAHIIVPNFTEATFLANKYQNRKSLNEEEALDLIDILHNLGAESVVITSMVIDGRHCTMLLDTTENKVKKLPYNMIPVMFPGTGDVFSAILIGKYLHGETLETSVQMAMDFVVKVIGLNKNNTDKYKGIPIEQYLEQIH